MTGLCEDSTPNTPESQDDIACDVKEANNNTILESEEYADYCFLCKTLKRLALDVRFKLSCVLAFIMLIQWGLVTVYWFS